MKKKLLLLMTTVFLVCLMCIPVMADASTTIKVGADTEVPVIKQNGTTYLKFKAPKTGYVSIVQLQNASTCVTLLNNKKKIVSGKLQVSGQDGTAVFAVKKNSTYFFKVDVGSNDLVTYRVGFQALKEKSGSKVSKAVSIKKGNMVQGLILPGENKKDYFKMKVSKKQEVKIQITGKVSSGPIQIKLYSDKKLKKSIGTIEVNTNTYNRSFSIFTLGSTKLQKGTYYYVVQRGNKKANGYYGIRWVR